MLWVFPFKALNPTEELCGIDTKQKLTSMKIKLIEEEIV